MGLGRGTQTVVTGHDVQQQECVEGEGPAAIPEGVDRMSSRLSERQDVVTELESTHLLLDYLIQNGALAPEEAETVREADTAALSNVALLCHLEEGGESSVRLLVSGLRQTGQLHLASVLDDSDRIKALSGSGYLSKSRHKGQVSLQVQIQALRLPPESSIVSSSLLPARGWVSLDDILLQIHSLMQPPPVPEIPEVPPEVPQFEILETAEEDEQKKPSCFCGCISKLFSSKHKSEKEKEEAKKKAMNIGQKYEVGRSSIRSSTRNSTRNSMRNSTRNSMRSSMRGTQSVERDVNPWRKSESFRAGMSEEELRTSLENLHNAADSLRHKCRQFYTIASDTSTPLGLALVRHFEQQRGALVLEATPTDSHLLIVTISMQLQPLQQLSVDCQSGQLLKDLESLLVTQDVLDRLGALELKLAVKLDEQEFEMAETELI